ncbi:ornithine utilization transcriptional regulator OruR [Maricurvus nonylphenolicus]|uniref:AraC family transcriptional regulator n=1 Tax=Maricurvus nonylphenolicus TaxID=1008307 RepID=UPI0036F3E7DA
MRENLRQPLAPFARQDKVIPVYLFQLIKNILQSEGIPIDSLTKGSEVSAEDLAHQDTLISFDQSMVIIANALKLSGDPAFGLKVGSLEKLNDLGILGYALSCCSDAKDALRITQAYGQTTTNLATIELSLAEEQVIYESNPIHPVPPELYRFLAEEALMCFVNLSRREGQIETKPLEMHFAYPEPDYVQEYHGYFQCPLFFDAESNKAIMSAKALDVPNPAANQVTAELAIKLCDDMLTRQDSQRSLINKIQLIFLRDEDNFPTAKDIAEELGLSERNMRRILKELNTSFQEIFDDVRKDMAISYLENSDLMQEDIAEKLGFSEASSFYRAFKKWTGKPPTAYRKS